MKFETTIKAMMAMSMGLALLNSCSSGGGSSDSAVDASGEIVEIPNAIGEVSNYRFLLDGGKYGIADANGKSLVECRYDTIYIRQEPKAFVAVEGEKSYILPANLRQPNLVAAELGEVSRYANYSSAYQITAPDGKKYYYHDNLPREDVQLIAGPFYDFTSAPSEIELPNGGKSRRLIALGADGKMGLWNVASNSEILPARFDKLYLVDIVDYQRQSNGYQVVGQREVALAVSPDGVLHTFDSMSGTEITGEDAIPQDLLAKNPGKIMLRDTDLSKLGSGGMAVAMKTDKFRDSAAGNMTLHRLK